MIQSGLTMRFFAALFVALITVSGAASQDRQSREHRFELAKDDVIVFVGGTNVLHLQQAGYLEAALTQRFWETRPKFRDLSWEADTVFRQGTVIERWRSKAHFGEDGGLGNIGDQLRSLRTTIVIAQFGQLESMAGKESLNQFVSAYERLADVFRNHARLVVLVTPTPFEKPSSPLIPDLSQQNADLAQYVKAIKRIAEDRNLILVDMFTSAKPGLTDNGVHIKPSAQAHVAQQIARHLGVQTRDELDLETLRKAVIEKHRLWYDYWRPANWKLLYGDDARRQFTRGEVPFREEWKQLVPLIEKAEQRNWQIASGGKDPGTSRPEPEKLHGDLNADIEKELAAFSTPDEFEVNLFACEREGLTSPLAIRWDPAGRMYVTVTTTYPHVFPGVVPNDKIIVLEDTDRDGRADTSTLFADGLNIPTGLEWGDGGVYVGQNTEILFLQDTDGDGRADQRRVVLSGFGNGDSHQTINSFRWSPDGELYFGHGDGCESRVETPWGASNLFNAGFYRFRPKRLQLLPFLEGHMGPGNPWGIGFDDWGQVFNVDGAGGVNWLTPGLVSTTHRQRFPRIGDPGGYCGIGYLDGRHLPQSMHGDFVIGDFKANRIKRFSLEANGAGFSLNWEEPVLRSSHRNFRPVDVKVGPDGAIYVVDWYNPITCHQDDAYRHPARDKAHGRVWRISLKKSLVEPPNLEEASNEQVVASLQSPERWERYQAKREMTRRDPADVAAALDKWVRSLDPKMARYEHHLYEALGAFATIEVVERNLLNRLLQGQDPRVRAFATHIVGRWHDRLDNPLDLLAARIIDEHPHVRLEAVVACSAIPSPRSIEVAAHILDKPHDGWTEYAFKQTVHGLRPSWMPAFKRGDVSFARPDHLAAVLNETGGQDVLESLKQVVESDDLEVELKASAIGAILAVGDARDLRDFGLATQRFTGPAGYDAPSHAAALARLKEVARARDVRPEGNLDETLNHLIGQSHVELQANALALAGVWRVEGSKKAVLAAANDVSLATSIRLAAFKAIAEMKLPEARETFVSYADKPSSLEVQAVAIQSLATIDLKAAAAQAARLLDEPELKSPEVTETFGAMVGRETGAYELSLALSRRPPTQAAAKRLVRAMYASGRTDPGLMRTLNGLLGAAAELPNYSETFVKRLVRDAAEDGNEKRGAILFQSMGCTTCHKVGGSGGIVGPDLTAIGTTLSSERIVEELLWPSRQIKEGYSTFVVVTTDGRVRSGYQRITKESEKTGDTILQDITTQKLITIRKEDIEEKRLTGSTMPTGITALLSKSQLSDLVKYLSELGRIK